MRLVLDTGVLVAAIRSDRGASRQLLRAAFERRYVVLASVSLMLEYESVLTRQEHLAASRLSVEDVSALLDAVALVAEPVRLAFLWRPMLKDPNDDMVLEAAVNGEADALVTFNQRDFADESDRFGLPLWTPRDAFARLESQR